MNINKGLGYIATAAVAIAVIYFTGDTVEALAITGIGFWLVSNSKI